MDTITVYPTLDRSVEPPVSRVVLAEDLVTVITSAGAIVPKTQYYLDLLCDGSLTNIDPLSGAGGTPIQLLVAPIKVIGTAAPGEVLVFTDANTAEPQAFAAGSGSTAGLLVSELAAIPITADMDGQVRFTIGYSADGDGGGGDWYAAYGSSATANGWTVVSATGGRWIRRGTIPGSYLPQWTGAKGNGSTNDYGAFNNLCTNLVPGTGGHVDLPPGTYPLNSAPLTFPRHITLDTAPGALISIPAFLDSVVLGGIRSSGRHKLFTVASNARMMLPGHTVPVEWFGAVADDSTDCSPAIVAALQGLSYYAPPATHSSGFSGGGGKIAFNDMRLPYKASAVAHNYIYLSNTVLEGDGIIHHNADTAFASKAPFFQLWHNISFGWNEDFRVRNLRVFGNSSEDFSQPFSITGVRRCWVDGVYIKDFASEGIIFPSTAGAEWVKITRCHAENIGKGGAAAISVTSAYNPNARVSQLIGCTAYDVGMFVEQTGDDFICIGNVFKKASFRGVALHSSTWNSDKAIVLGNIISHAPTGIYYADQGSASGRALSACNVIAHCDQAINVGAVGGHTCVAHGDYIIGGSTSGDCIVVGAGASHIHNQTIDRVTGSTTGSISIGSSSLTSVPVSSGLANGMKVTSAAWAGSLTVLDAVYTGALTATLSANATGALIGGAVSYDSGQWARVFRCDTDDYYTIRDCVILGVPWSSEFARLSSFRGTLGPFTFQTKGQTVDTSKPIIMIRDPLGNAAAQLLPTDFDMFKPWVYSALVPSFFHASAVPTAKLTWKVGDTIHNTSFAAGAPRGWFCSVAGTAGTLNAGATTGSITTGSRTITSLNSLVDLYPGAVINVGGGVGVRTIESINAGASSLAWKSTEAASGSTAAGVSIGFSNPTFIAFGGQAAAQSDSVAATVGALVTDFNALLAKLRTAGLMA